MWQLDGLAKRYGVLPSEFLKQDNFDFLFNLFVASLGAEKERRDQRDQQRRLIDAQRRPRG